MNVLSLFDGISCGQVALQRAGIRVDNYYASEIDKYAITIAKNNFPNIVEIGDVTKVFYKDGILCTEKGEYTVIIDLLIGGTPCQGFSFAGKGLNFDDPRSKLFFEYVRILQESNPKFFLLENVRMKREYQNVITSILKVEPIMIDSALVSAQSRKRLYWTNIPNIQQPENRNIYLKDIVENSAVDLEKAHTIDADCFKSGSSKNYNTTGKSLHQSEKRPMVKDNCIQIGEVDLKEHDILKRVDSLEEKCPALNSMGGENREPKIVTNIYPSGGQNGNVFSLDGKSPTLSAGQGVVGNGIGSSNAPKITENFVTWRKLTVVECERLQTLPDNYTSGVSNTQRYKTLGNGWTVDVIAHLFSCIPDD